MIHSSKIEVYRLMPHEKLKCTYVTACPKLNFVVAKQVENTDAIHIILSTEQFSSFSYIMITIVYHVISRWKMDSVCHLNPLD
jgi:hypothetical protein